MYFSVMVHWIGYLTNVTKQIYLIDWAVVRDSSGSIYFSDVSFKINELLQTCYTV